ncbi:MAG: CHRD domain-containing protein, partial [Myxococcota bacterium]
HNSKRTFGARLSGFLETPASISSAGSGRFKIRVNSAKSAAEYELEYEDLEGASVLFAHIHLGQPRTTGGVMVFLCSNSGSPVPTPACPGPAGGTVTGTLTADDLIGPSDQGVAPGEFEEFVDALRRDGAYVNVHTDLFQSGEIRGNIR